MLLAIHCCETLLRMDLVTKIDYGKLIIPVVYMDFFDICWMKTILQTKGHLRDREENRVLQIL